MNELLLVIEIVVIFGLLILCKKLFGKTGLMCWNSIALIIANIQVCKSIVIFGIDATLGNVLFASTFLVTDILTECYGKKEAKKSIIIGISSVILFIICTQFAIIFKPSNIDISHNAMQTLFSITPRISIASLLMCGLANIVDVYIYDKLKQKTKGKMMWLRNNICTIFCNCIENFGFVIIAFLGIYSLKDIFIIAISTSIIEIIIALCDTPFLYMAKNMKDLKVIE